MLYVKDAERGVSFAVTLGVGVGHPRNTRENVFTHWTIVLIVRRNFVMSATQKSPTYTKDTFLACEAVQKSVRSALKTRRALWMTMSSAIRIYRDVNACNITSHDHRRS